MTGQLKSSQMDKTCEFCGESKAIVNCRSDAAFLCLSCDIRVHSANALSSRHSRGLLCECCGHQWVSVRCVDHRLLMCRRCDLGAHCDQSGQQQQQQQHQKHVVESYTGCPSAKEFGLLWGYDINSLSGLNSVVPGMANLDISGEFRPWADEGSSTSEMSSMTSVFGVQSQQGMGNHLKTVHENQQQQGTRIILQQILDLGRLHVPKRNNHAPVIRAQLKTDVCLSQDDIRGLQNETLDQNHQNPQGFVVGLQQGGSVYNEQQVHQHYPFPFPQLEHLNSSLTGGIPLNGDLYWQCKSPAQSNQLWHQNMQDLGTCEEDDFHDGLSIPDVDLTFRNIEELFSGEKGLDKSLFDDIGMECSSPKKDISVNESDNGHKRGTEHISLDPSSYNTLPQYGDVDISIPDQTCNVSRSTDFSHQVQPTYLNLSASLSWLSAESSASDCIDSGLSSNFMNEEPSWNSQDIENGHSEARGNAMRRYKEKKKVRMFDKKVRYASRKAEAVSRKRLKGRFVKAEK